MRSELPSPRLVWGARRREPNPTRMTWTGLFDLQVQLLILCSVLCACTATPPSVKESSASGEHRARARLATDPPHRAIALSRRGERLWVVQTAVQVFQSSDHRRVVTLVATHHCGTPRYYRAIEHELRDADVIWAEGLTPKGGPEVEADDLPKPLRLIKQYQDTMAEAARLSKQGDWERNVVDDRWKNADSDLAAVCDMVAAMPPDDRTSYEHALEGSLNRLRVLARREDATSVQSARLIIVGGVASSGRGASTLARVQAARESAAWTTIVAGLGTFQKQAILFGADHIEALAERLEAAGFVWQSTSWLDVLSVAPLPVSHGDTPAR